MDVNEIQNDKINSSLIKIEKLEKKYEVVLKQYQEAVNNYIDTLQTDDARTFTSLPGRAWWGSSGVKEASVETEAECETMCASDINCTGATFNPVKRYCWTRGGDASISPGTTDDTAIIPSKKSALIVMQGLNTRLIKLNEEVLQEMQNSSQQVEEQQTNKDNTNTKLLDSYQQLMEQKGEIEQQMSEYVSIEENNNADALYVQQANVSYRAWVLITMIIVLICVKQMIGPTNSIPAIISFWTILLILMVILTFSLSTSAGFMTWGLLIVVALWLKP